MSWSVRAIATTEPPSQTPHSANAPGTSRATQLKQPAVEPLAQRREPPSQRSRRLSQPQDRPTGLRAAARRERRAGAPPVDAAEAEPTAEHRVPGQPRVLRRLAHPHPVGIV